MSSRSAYRKMSSNTHTMVIDTIRIKRNAKNHPTIGMLTLRRQEHVNEVKYNPYLDRCTTLQLTANTLYELYDNPTSEQTSDMRAWRNEIYRKVYEFVNRSMCPSFDDMDDMLVITRVLLNNKLKCELEEFILNCPKRFIITFVNNSEHALQTIEQMGLTNIHTYLLGYLDNSTLYTWNERH